MMWTRDWSHGAQRVRGAVAARGGYLCHGWRGQQAERLIRRGFRIAHRLKAAWYVAFPLERHHSLSLDDEQRLTALQTLTERLGERSLSPVNKANPCRFFSIGRADAVKATQLIIGRRRWPDGSCTPSGE